MIIYTVQLETKGGIHPRPKTKEKITESAKKDLLFRLFHPRTLPHFLSNSLVVQAKRKEAVFAPNFATQKPNSRLACLPHGCTATI